MLHEAPPQWTVEPAGRVGARPRVLFVSIFAPDEPVREVVEAAALLPSIDVQITGDLHKIPPGLRDSAPPNVSFLGFLRGADYSRAVSAADIVMALTTEPMSVVRAGCEAVYAGRPLVVSHWRASREVFPYAVHVSNDPAGIAVGMRAAVERHPQLLAAAPAARSLQATRWRHQIDRVRERLRGPVGAARRSTVDGLSGRSRPGARRFRPSGPAGARAPETGS